jgi:hypothetical protein
MTEFIALANHRPAIRDEIRSYSERVRKAQVTELTRVLRTYDVSDAPSPAALAVLMVAVSRFMQMESAFGIDFGHDDLVASVEAQIRALEGARQR